MALMFVSHASEDAAIARAVAEALRAHGVGIWIAPDSIAPGQSYNEAIMAGLRGSDAICVLISRAANASKHVQREVALADDLGKRIVPIRVESIEPSDGLAYYLSLPQWVEWHAHGAAALAPLVAALRGDTPAPAPPAPLPPPVAGAGARIEIRRPSAASAMARKFQISVDGHQRGELANGAAMTLEVTPGRHELTARLDYVKSAAFVLDAQAGRAYVLEVSAAKLSDLGGQAAALFGQSSYFSWKQIA